MTFSNPPTLLKYEKFHTFFEGLPNLECFLYIYSKNKALYCDTHFLEMSNA